MLDGHVGVTADHLSAAPSSTHLLYKEANTPTLRPSHSKSKDSGIHNDRWLRQSLNKPFVDFRSHCHPPMHLKKRTVRRDDENDGGPRGQRVVGNEGPKSSKGGGRTQLGCDAVSCEFEAGRLGDWVIDHDRRAA